MFLFWREDKDDHWVFYPDPTLYPRSGTQPALRLDWTDGAPEGLDHAHRYAHIIAALAALIVPPQDKTSEYLREASGELFDMVRRGGVELRDADTREILWECKPPQWKD